MTTEFKTLSEKICGKGYIRIEEDVKEFIRLLKERFCEDGEFREDNEKESGKCHNCKFIDNLAGSKLTEEKT